MGYQKLKFKSRTFIGVKDFKPGGVYIFKDGRIALYLGKSVSDKLCFYNICRILLHDYPDVSFDNYDLTVEMTIKTIERQMQMSGFVESFYQLTTKPSIYGEFPFVDLSNVWMNWYLKTLMSGVNIPFKLAESVNNAPKSLYVPAKDIVAGRLYYTGCLWRSLYLYCGRDSNGMYLWYFVGNSNELIRHVNDFRYFVSKSSRLKNQKRVKDLMRALEDEEARPYIHNEERYLIDNRFTLETLAKQYPEGVGF